MGLRRSGLFVEYATVANERAGMEPGAASDLAHLMIATLEGAHVLCRAAASLTPFDSAARALRAGVARPRDA